MVNIINNNLPPFVVRTQDASKSNLFSVSSVNQGVKLSSYGYTDSAVSDSLIFVALQKVLNDSVTITENIGFSNEIFDSSSAQVEDLLGVIDGITYNISKIFNDSVNITEVLETLYAVGRQPLDSSSASDVNTIFLVKNINDSSNISEIFSYNFSKTATTDIISPIELLAKNVARPLNDSSTVTELYQSNLSKPFADSTSVTDAGLISIQDYFLEIYVSDLQPYVEKSNTTF